MFMILKRYVELQPAWFKVKAKTHWEDTCCCEIIYHLIQTSSFTMSYNYVYNTILLFISRVKL